MTLVRLILVSMQINKIISGFFRICGNVKIDFYFHLFILSIFLKFSENSGYKDQILFCIFPASRSKKFCNQ